MLFVTVFTALLANLVLALEAPIPGYEVHEITWKVDPFNNGTTVEIAGSVEEVVAKVKKINPAFHLEVIHENNEEHTVADPNTVCGGASASLFAIVDGIDYLRGVPGQPGQGAAPRSCGRVSCSYSSAIWWCNDNTEPYTLSSFGAIADCARNIVDSCRQDVWLVRGQRFMDGNWNCIVRRDHDEC